MKNFKPLKKLPKHKPYAAQQWREIKSAYIYKLEGITKREVIALNGEATIEASNVFHLN